MRWGKETETNTQTHTQTQTEIEIEKEREREKERSRKVYETPVSKLLPSNLLLSMLHVRIKVPHCK